MADHREKLGEGRELEMFVTTPAVMAASQIAQAGQDLTDYWSDVTTTIPDSVRSQNLAAAEFMELVALAIYEDRLVILDEPRRGRGMILTPPAQTFHEQQREASASDLSRMVLGKSTNGHQQPRVVPAEQFDSDDDLPTEES